MDDSREKDVQQIEAMAAFVRFGALELRLGRIAEAERLLTEAIAVGERSLGAEHPSLAVAVNELSRLHIRQSDFARAEPLLERLLHIARAKGDRHPDVATALAGLAVAKRGLGDDASAEQLYRQALRIREEVLAPDHMAIVVTLEQLSDTCAARGNVPEALVHLERALLRRERALGAEHATVHALRARIADLQRRQDESIAAAAARLATPPIPTAAVAQGPASAASPALVIADAPVIGDSSRDVAAPKWSRRRTTRFASAGAAALVLTIGGFGVSASRRNESEPARAPSAVVQQGAVVTPASYAASQPAIGDSSPEAAPGRSAIPSMTTDSQPAPAEKVDAARSGIAVALPRLRKLVVPKIAMPSVDSLVRAATKDARDADSELIAAGGTVQTPARIDDAGATPPVLISAPTLRFPDELRAQRVEGEVVVQLRVNEKGRVDPSGMRVMQSDHELFTAAVRNVLSRFRFEPARSAAPQSKPQSAWVQFRAQFTAAK